MSHAARNRSLRVAFVVALAALASACEGLIGADFDRSGRDGGASNGGDGSALADGNVIVDGASFTDGAIGSTDGGTKSDSGASTFDAAGTGRSPLDVLGMNLKIWLYASKDVFTSGGNPNVVAWNDQSGNKINGMPFGNGGGQLTLLNNDINGLPSVEIDSDALNFAEMSPAIGATDDFYIAVVARYETLGGSQDRFFFSRFESDHGFGLYAGSAGSSAIAGTLDLSGVVEKSPDTTTADNKYRVYALRRTNSTTPTATIDVRVNGVSTSGSIPNGIAVTDDVRPLIFGGAQQAAGGAVAQFMVGAIAELVVVQGTVPDASITEVETNWIAKYALH